MTEYISQHETGKPVKRFRPDGTECPSEARTGAEAAAMGLR